MPRHGSADGSTFGLNVPGCGGAARSIRDSYFCPLPDGDTWLGEAYALDVVDDPKGPHDGHWYVKARPKFKIRRRELVNAYLYPGAGVPPGSSAPKEFYAANKEAGFPIDEFIRYVEKHEGPGQQGRAAERPHPGDRRRDPERHPTPMIPSASSRAWSRRPSAPRSGRPTSGCAGPASASASTPGIRSPSHGLAAARSPGTRPSGTSYRSSARTSRAIRATALVSHGARARRRTTATRAACFLARRWTRTRAEA